jgi:hypothetical protein
MFARKNSTLSASSVTLTSNVDSQAAGALKWKINIASTSGAWRRDRSGVCQTGDYQLPHSCQDGNGFGRSVRPGNDSSPAIALFKSKVSVSGIHKPVVYT